MIMTAILMGLVAILLTALALFTIFYAIKFCIKLVELAKIVHREPECHPPLPKLELVKANGTSGNVIDLAQYKLKRK